MTETQHRIRAYKNALPQLKERVMAVALLLAISVAMMTSASFAWITLSKAPAVNGLATTVSTNGNLEIALSGVEGLQPNESGITDGSGNITQSNLTWGNLVNLSDSSYGLDKIVLRPASLNVNELLTSPVQAVKYGADGRINGYITDFAFTNYDSTLQDFGVSAAMKYGVRGVSSVTYKNITGNKFIVDQVDEIKRRYAQACVDFAQIYQSDEYMAVVGALVQTHANYTLNGGDIDCASYMPQLKELMDAFQGVIDDIGMVYVEIANLYYYQSLTDITQYQEFMLEDLVNDRIPAQFTQGLAHLEEFYMNEDSVSKFNKTTMYNRARVAYDGVNVAATKAEKGQTVSWKNDLMKYADILCDFETATIHGYRVEELVGNYGAMAQVALNKDTCEAVVVQGVIKDADQFIDGEFAVPNKKISVTVDYLITLTARPAVRTAAEAPYYLGQDIAVAEEKASSGGSNYKGDAVAAETYAMAIDLWVRTNAQDSLLILEGELITEERTVTDADGNTVYTEKLDENGNVERDENGEPIMVPLKETVNVGYQGVNRVWNELDDPNSSASAAISGLGTSITQGSGSCYVFYPQSIDDRNQCLKLLSAMQIVFFGEDGTQMAKAYMDTANPLEQSGRILVPLKLYDNSDTVVDADGKEYKNYITALTQNEAVRITAMVYLDGSNLSNSDVLAAGSITGQLNLQFGTTEMNMDAMDDSDLMDDYYTINVTSNKNYTFAENLTEWTYPLQMTIVGMEPKTVKANFISVISATQGARQETFNITKNTQTGFYEANVEFAGPGNYQLRSVQIDGVDYALDEVVYVTIPGESVSSLIWGDGTTGNEKTVLTAESFYQQPLRLTLRTGSRATVRAVFVGDNGSNITVNFASNDGVEYTATANFNASGTYKLEYVYINDSPTPLDPGLQKTIDISLGLRAQVNLSEPYVYDETDNTTKIPATQTSLIEQYSFTPGSGHYFVYTAEAPIFFDIRCKIVNDRNEEIKNLTGVEINYGQGRSEAYALSAGLDWNASENCYTKTFEFQDFGIFEFQNLVVNRVNYVTRATSAHSITAVSKDPMEYVPSEFEELVFDLSNTPKREMSLVLKNASAARLDITLTNLEDPTQTYTVTDVQGTKDGDNSVFKVENIPDGLWSITAVRASSVFYKAPGEENGKFYPGGADPKDWLDLTDLPNWQDNPTTRFVTAVNVELIKAHDSYAFTSKFMEKSHVIPQGDLALSFTAYDGKPITHYAQIAGKELNVTANGSYIWSANKVTVQGGVDNVAVTGGGKLTGTNLTLNAITFLVDGNYGRPDLTVTISGDGFEKEYTLPGALPQVTVTWTAPTVTITSISPSGSFTVDASGNGSGHGNTPTNTTNTSQNMAPGIYNNNKTAWVYYKCTTQQYKPLGGIFGSTTYHTYITDAGYGNPKVTMKLEGLDASFTSATLLFGDDAKIYETVQYTTSGNNGTWETKNLTTFAWTSNGTEVFKYVGYAKCQKSRSSDVANKTGEKTPAGTITANQLDVNVGGKHYIFTIDPITIHNPY